MEKKSFQENLSILIRAKYPIIYLQSAEERRAINQIYGAAESLNVLYPQNYRKVFSFSCTMGLMQVQEIENEGEKRIVESPIDSEMTDPAAVLSAVVNSTEPSIFILKDFDAFMGDYTIDRLLRDVFSALKTSFKTLIILSPVLKIPSHMEKEIYVLSLDLPRQEDILSIMKNVILPKKGLMNIDEGEDTWNKIARNCLGLTYQEAENAISRSIVERKEFSIDNLPIILQDKENVIKKEGILEFIKCEENAKDIAGNVNVINYFKVREKAFSKEAREFGLPRPRGCILVGVPGVGKTLSAKVLSGMWNLPLIKLDAGKILGKFMGDSEGNMEKILLTLESIAPCILLIDEITRLFGGMLNQSSNANDGGVGNRIAGRFLNWLQESQEEIFVIGTSNELEGIPPEFTARFDRIFFADYPSESERKDIFRIHLQKRKRNPDSFNLSLFAAKSINFSGREIERSIIDALFDAFNAGTDIEDRHILDALKGMKTMFSLNKEKLDSLRKWAEARCEFASPREEAITVSTGGRNLEV